MIDCRRRPPSVKKLLLQIHEICDELFAMRFELLFDRRRAQQMHNSLYALVNQIAERRLQRQTAARVMRELRELEDLMREGLLRAAELLWIAVRRIRARVVRVV